MLAGRLRFNADRSRGGRARSASPSPRPPRSHSFEIGALGDRQTLQVAAQAADSTAPTCIRRDRHRCAGGDRGACRSVVFRRAEPAGVKPLQMDRRGHPAARQEARDGLLLEHAARRARHAGREKSRALPISSETAGSADNCRGSRPSRFQAMPSPGWLVRGRRGDPRPGGKSSAPRIHAAAGTPRGLVRTSSVRS